jgi:two-component system aerobic respiration control protein ArcA
MTRRINTKDFISKIEKLAKSKIVEQDVVQLGQIRDLKRKIDPKVILVIEDDETMRTALKRMFESDGFLVKLAADATELSTVLDERGVDLILLDIGLPWINGFELAELMKDHRDLRKIPLVFVSGQSTPEDIKRAFDLGANDFIKKPFDVERMRKTVRTLLQIAN